MSNTEGATTDDIVVVAFILFLMIMIFVALPVLATYKATKRIEAMQPCQGK